MARIPAFDVLFSPEALSCSSAATPAFACVEHPDSLVAAMQEVGVQKALLAPCKQWRCERHWICGEVQVDEIASYIQAAPARLAGLASYNPYCIIESLSQIRSAVRLLDMRGVYVHTEGAQLSILDRRMYPLYARCVELAVPIVVQVGSNGKEHLAAPADLAEIAKDFSELEIVGAWKGALDLGMMRDLMARHPNLYFAFPVSNKTEQEAIAALLSSPFGARCMWGSNGLPWEELLENIDSLGLPESVLQAFLNGTAARLFQLSRNTLPQIPSGERLSLAE